MTTATTTTDQPTDAPTTDVDQPDPPPVDPDKADDKPDDKAKSAGKDAAKYRTRLRETEAQRDALSGRLEALQRAEVERLASTSLSVGEDVFTLGGVELADLLDENGDVDPDAVRKVAVTIAKARPGVARAGRDFGQGRRGAAPGKGNDWAAAFRRA